MAIKRLRNPKVSCIQHIDVNSLTVQEIDDYFEEEQVVPVENVSHQPVENVITGVLNDDLTGDFIDLTGEFVDLTDDGVITGEKEKLFLTQSFDPTTHFETAITDVLEVYKRITGKELELTDGQGGAAEP